MKESILMLLAGIVVCVGGLFCCWIVIAVGAGLI